MQFLQLCAAGETGFHGRKFLFTTEEQRLLTQDEHWGHALALAVNGTLVSTWFSLS